MLTKVQLENRLLEILMAFCSIFQLEFTENRLKSAKTVELRQNQIHQKLLACLFFLAAILITATLQQYGWGIIAFAIFPVFFLPGLGLAVMSLVLTLDFSKKELTLTSQLLWMTVLSWSTGSLTSRDITIFKARKVIVRPWSRSERWHIKIEISKNSHKFVFFTGRDGPFDIIKKFITYSNSKYGINSHNTRQLN